VRNPLVRELPGVKQGAALPAKPC